MSPIYDYFCQGCGNSFEKLVSYESRDSASCEMCGSKATRKMSRFSWKWYNKFTKDGEGFSSVSMSKQEAKERVRANAGKYD